MYTSGKTARKEILKEFKLGRLDVGKDLDSSTAQTFVNHLQ